jgi:hypothetical protein
MTTYKCLYCKFSQILVLYFLFSPIPDVISVTWILYKLKFSHNCTCVSQGLATEVPENTKRMHTCITLVLCPESGDRCVGQVGCKLLSCGWWRSAGVEVRWNFLYINCWLIRLELFFSNALLRSYVFWLLCFWIWIHLQQHCTSTDCDMWHPLCYSFNTQRFITLYMQLNSFKWNRI